MCSALALAFAACGAPSPILEPPSPAELPGVEERYREDPGDVDTGLLLVAGYRAAGRAVEAGQLLVTLREQEPDDPGLTLMGAFLAEDAGEFEVALSEFGRFLDSEPDEALAGEIERRMEAVRLQALQANVRNALAREEEVAQQVPEPGTIGVFPFVLEGGDPDWQPLALAMADLLSTDLGITGRLSVVERTAVQVLITELQLGESGRVEPGTAARSGRLLGSRHIVQGRIRVEDGSSIDIDASLVGVGEPGAEEVDPLTGSNVIERIFELEKQLALDIYEELGIQLTSAERELVNERQTESIEALLAYGRGLEASDAGDFELARQEFSRASTIDPSFSLTQQRQVEATRLAPAPAVQNVTTLASAARQVRTRQNAVQQLTQAPAAIQQRVLQNLGVEKRTVLAEILGQDRVGQVILLELIFRGPGGLE